jgi:hypothetical protein
VHYADQAIPAQESGRYVIKLTVKGGARFETTSTQEVFVHSFPYLEVTQPAPLQTYPLGEHLAVEVALKRDGTSTDPEKEFENHPNVLILAQLKESPYATESPAIWLNQQEAKSLFRGIVPHELRQTGRYTLALQLAGTPRVSDRLRLAAIVERVDFFVAPSPGQTVERWAISGGSGLGLLASVWGVAWATWLWRAPKAMASLEVREEGAVVFNSYLPRGLLKPTTVRGQTGRPLRIWARARDADSLYVVKGGWPSFLTFGLVGRSRLVRRGEERDIDAIWRVGIG